MPGRPARSALPFLKQLQAATALIPSGSPAELLAALKKAAGAGESEAMLEDKAEGLIRAAVATRFYREEGYTDELQRLDAAVNGDPKNVEKLTALGAFRLRPTIVRPVNVYGKSGTAAVPLGPGDANLAIPPLDRALAVDPKHIGALTQRALCEVKLDHLNIAIDFAQRALDAGGMNLDLVRIYLNYYTMVANELLAQARFLRMPKSHTEDRADGTYLVTIYPSAAELALAAQLEKRSIELRKQSIKPLEQFAEATKAGGGPAHHMAQCRALSLDRRVREVRCGGRGSAEDRPVVSAGTRLPHPALSAPGPARRGGRTSKHPG